MMIRAPAEHPGVSENHLRRFQSVRSVKGSQTTVLGREGKDERKKQQDQRTENTKTICQYHLTSETGTYLGSIVRLICLFNCVCSFIYLFDQSFDHSFVCLFVCPNVCSFSCSFDRLLNDQFDCLVILLFDCSFF